MKKIYMFAALAAMALGAHAQTITFTMDGKEIPNGETIRYDKMEIKEDYGDDGYDYVYEPNLYFSGSATGSIDAHVVCTTGQAVQFCLNGLCVNEKDILKENVPIEANTPQDTMFEFMGMAYSADEMPPQDVTVDISIKYTGKPETETTIRFIFNPSDASVSTLGEDGVKVSAANGEIRYETATPATLRLYSVQGIETLKAAVSGKGTLSTAGLANGLYIYTLGSKTGKIRL